MIKTISQIIYFFLKTINLFFKKIFNRNLLGWLKIFIEEDSYKKVKLKSGNELTFFSPNFLTDLLIKDFYTKEPETIGWINNFKKEEKIIFWDIGSNIGLYSIYAATINQNIEVISFEPSTSNLRILSRNISINNLSDRIKIFQIPLGKNKNQFLKLNERKFNEGESHNSIDDNIDFEGKKLNPTNSYKLFTTNIDQIIDDKILDIPNYIKIDVDGIEHLILKGGSKMLKNPKILEIQIEINENFSEQHNSIIKIMKDCMFKFKEKKRNDLNQDYSQKEFSKIYNYYFTR